MKLLGHATLMVTNRYCQAVGFYDAAEAHKKYSPIDSIKIELLYIWTSLGGRSLICYLILKGDYPAY